MVRIIGIISGKGGVGKTTIGLNLGASLAHHFDKNVTIIDCNVTTSHLGLFLGMYYCPITLNKVLREEYHIKESIKKHYTGLKVIPASLSLEDLEGVDVTKIREKLKHIFDENDYILLDASPGLGREAMAALKASDEVLYVTSPYIPFIMDIIRCQEVANEVGVKPLGIVLNKIHKKRYEMSPKEIKELTKLPVISSIPFDKNVHKSLSLKMPVVMLKPKTAASKEIIKLASHLTGKAYKYEHDLIRFFKKFKFW